MVQSHGVQVGATGMLDTPREWGNLEQDGHLAKVATDAHPKAADTAAACGRASRPMRWYGMA